MMKPSYMYDDWWPDEIMVTANHCGGRLSFLLTKEIYEDKKALDKKIEGLRRIMWECEFSKKNG